MTRSTDQIVEKLLARTDLPPLEPGTKVYDQSLTGDIKTLKEDKFVIAGKYLNMLETSALLSEWIDGLLARSWLIK
jgi:hypothetical protein